MAAKRTTRISLQALEDRTTPALVINEVLFDPPGTDDDQRYIELRDTDNPGGIIAADTFFIAVEGDLGANPGEVLFSFDLGDETLGANGFLVLIEDAASFTIDGDAAVLDGLDLSGLSGGSVSFILGDDTGGVPAVGTDLDADNDGTPESLPGTATLLDSVGVTDGDADDILYADVSFTLGQGYVGRTFGGEPGDDVPFVAAQVEGTNDEPPFAVAAGESTFPAAFTGRALDHIGKANFEPTDAAAPVNIVPAGQTTDEDQGPLVFSAGGGNPITVTDTDSVTGADFNVEVTLTVTEGRLQLASEDSLTVAGNNTDSVTLAGPLNDVNAALNGVGYLPDPDFNGTDTLTITTDDLGNTGAASQTDTDTVEITVNATPEDPDAVGDTETTDEDNPVAIAVLDNDSGSGTITLASVEGVELSNGESVTLASGATVTRNADGTLTYDPQGQFDDLAPGETRDETFVYAIGNDTAFDAAEVTVTVEGVNDAPILTDVDDLSVEENAADGTPIGNVPVADVDSTLFTFEITAGDPEGLFAIDNNGLITVADGENLDFTAGGTFTLTVEATDDDALNPLSNDATVTIELINVNDAPVLNNQQIPLLENRPNGAFVGQIAASDEDALDELTFEVTGGTGDGVFTVLENGAVFVSDGSRLDFETTRTFTLEVAVTDDGVTPPQVIAGQTFNQLGDQDAVTVDEVNDGEALTNGGSSNDGAGLGFETFWVQTRDNATGPVAPTGDADDLVGVSSFNGPDAPDVAPDGTGVESGVEHNFAFNDADGRLELRFDAVDLTGLVNRTLTLDYWLSDADWSGDDSFTVTIADGSTTVTLLELDADGLDASEATQEATAGGWRSLTADLDAVIDDNNLGDSLVLTVAFDSDGSDENLFLDNLSFTASSPDPLSDTGVVTLALIDVNEAPDLGNSSVTINENLSDGALTLTLEATDPDANDSVTYEIIGGNDGGGFALGQTTGRLTIADTDAISFEDSDQIILTVRVTDTGGLTDTATVQVTVNDVPEPPRFTDPEFTLAEDATNGTAVGTLTAVDDDPTGVIEYRLTGGDADGTFAIGLTSGEITVADNAALDFETTPQIALEVETTDGDTQFTGTVTVFLQDVNEAPAVEDGTFTFPEDSESGDPVGTPTSSDPDAGDVLTFAITGGDTDDAFDIDAQTGEISLSDSGQIDFELNPQFVLTVEVTDQAGLTDTAEVTLNVTDVNEPPVLSDATFEVAANSPAGTVVGSPGAIDPDAGEALTYELIGGNEAGIFAVEQDADIVIVDAAALSQVGGQTVTLDLMVTDSGGLTDTSVLTIDVADVGQPPTLNDATFSVADGAAAGTTVGTLVGTDPDPDEILSYEILSGNEAGAFALDQQTGELTVADGALIDFGNNPVFRIEVAVRDRTDLTDSAAVTVNVSEPGNTLPVAGDDALSVARNAGATPLPVLANDTDADGDTLSVVQVTQPSSGTVEITGGGTGLTYEPDADFSGQDIFTYTVSDGRGGTDTAVVSLTVASGLPVDQNEVDVYAVAAGSGGDDVRLFVRGETEIDNIDAFDGSVSGGVRVATADVNGDGVPDYVVGTGPGQATQVRVIDGDTGEELFSVDPFEASFTGGVFVASGDFDGDGLSDIVITPDEGGGPRARVFSGATGEQLADFFAIEDPDFRGGARPAVGDIDGDGLPDLVVSAGFLGGPRLAVWGGPSVAAGDPAKLLDDFFAFEDSLRNGAFVASGDIDGDGVDDIIAGGGPGGAPRVRAFDGALLVAGGFDPNDPTADNEALGLANFFAGDPDSRGGVRVAAKDLDGDALADLVTAAGPDAEPQVNTYPGNVIEPQGTPEAEDSFLAFDAGFTGGVFVG